MPLDSVALERRASDSKDSLTQWPERCAHWLEERDAAKPKRLRRQRETAPLILVGHGLCIRVDKGALFIRDGNTHYPAERREHRFFKGGLDTPPRIVVVDGSGEITLDALDWMAAQGVALIRLTWDGEPTAIMNPTGYAADPGKVAWQRATRDDPDARLAFAIDLIAKKVRASVDTLRDKIPDSRARTRSLSEAASVSDALADAASISDVLGLEGRAATAYFNAWRAIEIKWKGTKRHPIPDEWTRYASRSSLTTGVKAKNRNASHPVNAMLNYAYAALEARLRIDAIANGYDPKIGIVHVSYRDSPAYVLDVMEPERPRVDAGVLELVRETTFSPADFTLRPDGVCRVNPELARRVVQIVEGKSWQ